MKFTLKNKLNRVYTMLNKQNKIVEDLRKAKDEAYAERNKLVCALSKLFPAWLGKHEETDMSWGKEWLNIVYIQLPTGQVSWHIHENLLPLFAHLELDTDKKWDGHTTDEKYTRLLNLSNK